MRYANIYIYIFVLHRDFFQQPRPRVGILVGRRLLNVIQCITLNARVKSVKSYIVVFKPLIVLMAWFIFDILSENRETALFASSMVLTTSFVEEL